MSNSFVKTACWLAISYLLHALTVGIADRHEADTLVGKILLPANAVDQHTTTQSISDVSSSLNEVVSFSFDAAVKLGIKRRSNIVGQIYDYLRLADQDAAVSVKLFESAADDTKHTSNPMTLAINVTFSGIDRSTDNLQSERNKHRCGSSDCISISQSVTTNSTASNLQYFEVNASSEAGTIEIDNQMYPIESSIYCLVYYSSNTSARDHIESVEFSAFIAELKTNHQNESISEIWISNYDGFISLLLYCIFMLLSIIFDLFICSKLVNIFCGYAGKDPSYYRMIAILISIPFSYLASLLRFNFISEFCPIAINVLVYIGFYIIFTITINPFAIFIKSSKYI